MRFRFLALASVLAAYGQAQSFYTRSAVNVSGYSSFSDIQSKNDDSGYVGGPSSAMQSFTSNVSGFATATMHMWSEYGALHANGTSRVDGFGVANGRGLDEFSGHGYLYGAYFHDSFTVTSTDGSDVFFDLDYSLHSVQNFHVDAATSPSSGASVKSELYAGCYSATETLLNTPLYYLTANGAGTFNLTDHYSFRAPSGSVFSLDGALGAAEGVVYAGSGSATATLDASHTGAFKIVSVSGNGRFTSLSGTDYTATPEPGVIAALAFGIAGIAKRKPRKG